MPFLHPKTFLFHQAKNTSYFEFTPFARSGFFRSHHYGFFCRQNCGIVSRRTGARFFYKNLERALCTENWKYFDINCNGHIGSKTQIQFDSF